ncbi:MAG: hypothetical protein AAGF24_07970 [Cyanobacteria bacterium P01_H01_bin.121]
MASESTHQGEPDDPQQREQDQLEREILTGRTFSLADVVGREASGFMKGESPIPKLVQAKTALKVYVDRHLVDSSGALQAVLADLIDTEDGMISQHLATPLQSLQRLLESLLQNQALFYEFAHHVEMKYGQLYGERPHFQQPGQPAHPDAEYTHSSVRTMLQQLLATAIAQSIQDSEEV